MASPSSELVAKVKFPLYCVSVLNDKHFLVAGGGGAANTGVKNGAEIWKLSHNGNTSRAELVKELDTGKDAVMNCTSFAAENCTFLAAGAEGETHIFSLKRKWRKFVDGEMIDSPKKEFPPHPEVRRRRSSSVSQSPPEQKPAAKPKPPKKPEAEDDVDYVAERVQNFKTDFSSDDPADCYQKVVRAHPKSSLLFTAGADGTIRVWNSETFDKVREITVSTKEIDDLAVAPDGSQLVCVLKDAVAPVFKVDGTKIHEMSFSPTEECKYFFKRVRFAEKFLVAIANPVGKRKLPAYIVKYAYPSYKLQKARKSKETLSALAVSRDERFVAVGAMFDGSVEIYVSFSLQLVKRIPNAHKSFITGLEFFPGFGAVHEASVLSISVDNTVQIHHVERRREIPLVPVLALGVIVLIATFCFCSFVDSYLTQ